jgi:hypothetical protein
MAEENKFFGGLKNMKLLKSKKATIAVVIALLMIMSSMSVFARGYGTDYVVTAAGATLGDLTSNAKDSGVYAQTHAYSQGVLDQDYVRVTSTGCPTVTNTGKNYTDAYTQGPGTSFVISYGYITRNGVLGTGRVAA